MEKIETQDYDVFLLQIKKQLHATVGREEGGKITTTGMGFLLPLPETFHKASEEEKCRLFWSDQRPEVVFLTENSQAGMGFQRLGEWKDRRLQVCREEVRQVLEKLDGRTVFYEQGETGKELPVLWMEYKSFVKRERLYNLSFLFHSKENMIMGNFFCLFEQYGRWKKEILELLGKISEE